MSYRLSGFGQLPLSAQQKVGPTASTSVLAPAERVAALQRATASLVPPGCTTLNALTEMRSWKSPPSAIPVGGALVWGYRLPRDVGASTGRSMGLRIGDRVSRAARAAGLAASAGGNWQWRRGAGYIPGEAILWFAFHVNGGTVSQSRLNSIVNGAFEAEVREQGMSWAPVVPIYLASADIPDDEAMETQVYVASALHSVLTWEDFRTAVAIGIFGSLSLTSNIRGRTRTGFEAVQQGLQYAENADTIAAEAERQAQSAVQIVEQAAATGTPLYESCPQMPCPPTPGAQATRAIGSARHAIDDALERIDRATAAASRLESEIADIQRTLRERVTAAFDATKARITETNPLRRQYAECALWKNADEQLRTASTRLRSEAAQAPGLIAALRAAEAAARQRLQEARDNVEAMAAEAARGGLATGFEIKPWMWGALAVGTVSFLGLAVFLRRSRTKRRAVTPNRRRRRSRQR